MPEENLVILMSIHFKTSDIQAVWNLFTYSFVNNIFWLNLCILVISILGLVFEFFNYFFIGIYQKWSRVTLKQFWDTWNWNGEISDETSENEDDIDYCSSQRYNICRKVTCWICKECKVSLCDNKKKNTHYFMSNKLTISATYLRP